VTTTLTDPPAGSIGDVQDHLFTWFKHIKEAHPAEIQFVGKPIVADRSVPIRSFFQEHEGATRQTTIVFYRQPGHERAENNAAATPIRPSTQQQQDVVVESTAGRPKRRAVRREEM